MITFGVPVGDHSVRHPEEIPPYIVHLDSAIWDSAFG